MAPISAAEHARGGAPAAASPRASCELVIRPPHSSRQARQRLAVFVAGSRDDLGRQIRARRLLVPVEGLQVVAHELLVETRRAHARAIAVRGPEARGVRRQHFVDEREYALAVDAEFELGVGNDDAAAARVFGREPVQCERGVAYRGGKLWTDE